MKCTTRKSTRCLSSPNVSHSRACSGVLVVIYNWTFVLLPGIWLIRSPFDYPPILASSPLAWLRPSPIHIVSTRPHSNAVLTVTLLYLTPTLWLTVSLKPASDDRFGQLFGRGLVSEDNRLMKSLNHDTCHLSRHDCDVKKIADDKDADAFMLLYFLTVKQHKKWTIWVRHWSLDR